MNQVEARELRHAVDELIQSFNERHRFSERDIRRMHMTWLGKIYAWAGKYRNVNLAKGDFPFAAARQVPRLMLEFEKGPLRQFTPCRFPPHDEVALAVAVVHTEFILIHPFREGNGRIGRLLAVLMALQAGCHHSTSAASQGASGLSISLRCEREWTETTNRWKRYLAT